MSSQSTPTHRIEYADPAMTPAPWRKHFGRPNVENLAKYVAKASSPAAATLTSPRTCPTGLTGIVKIVRQSDNKVVANYMA